MSNFLKDIFGIVEIEEEQEKTSAEEDSAGSKAGFIFCILFIFGAGLIVAGFLLMSTIGKTDSLSQVKYFFMMVLGIILLGIDLLVYILDMVINKQKDMYSVLKEIQETQKNMGKETPKINETHELSATVLVDEKPGSTYIKAIWNKSCPDILKYQILDKDMQEQAMANGPIQLMNEVPIEKDEGYKAACDALCRAFKFHLEIEKWYSKEQIEEYSSKWAKSIA